MAIGFRWDVDNPWAELAPNKYQDLGEVENKACSLLYNAQDSIASKRLRRSIAVSLTNYLQVDISKREQLERAVREGSAQAIYNYGEALALGKYGYEKSRTGLDELKRAADMGHPQASYVMAALYKGLEVAGYRLSTVDQEKGFYYLNVAAKAGHPKAAAELARSEPTVSQQVQPDSQAEMQAQRMAMMQAEQRAREREQERFEQEQDRAEEARRQQESQDALRAQYDQLMVGVRAHNERVDAANAANRPANSSPVSGSRKCGGMIINGLCCPDVQNSYARGLCTPM